MVLWVIFFFIVYWTFTQATEIEQWDPYEILGLSEVSGYIVMAVDTAIFMATAPFP